MKCVQRVNKELLPLKIGMFLWWGGYNAMFSYMAIHMKTLGLNVRQTGIIHSVLPVVQVTGQIGLGALADRFQKHRCVLITSLIASAALATVILYIPILERDEIYEDEILSATFYTYLALRLCFELFTSTTFNLYEAVTILLVKQHPKSNFGSQRTFATIGSGIFPALTGLLMDTLSSSEVTEFRNETVFTNATNTTVDTPESIVDFRILFYSFDVIVIIAVLVTWLWLRVDILNTENDYVEEKVSLSHFLKIVIRPEIGVFVLTVLFLGTFWGYTKIFVPWRMSELGSDKFLIGLNPFVSTAVGFVLVGLSSYIIKGIGHVPVMILSLFVYSGRFLGYSLLTVPFHFLLFDSLEGVTYHLLWVACVTYAGLLIPPKLVATAQGLIGSMHYCIGLGFSGLIGGAIIDQLGSQIAFMGMSLAALTSAIIFGFFYICYTKRLEK